MIDQFEQLPGIGPRTAQRLALYILRQPEEKIKRFANALVNAKSKVGQCKICFHLTSDETCEICQSTHRDPKTICVVSDSKDLIALERTKEYKGLYHVLGGLISPMDSIGPELLNIKSLVQRINDEDTIEVILALTPSVEGDTTSLYIARLLKPFVKVTRIAYGLPVGSELEYADEVTLTRALEGRTDLE